MAKKELTKDDLVTMRPATMIDRLFTTRTRRYEIQHRVKAMEAEESMLRRALIEKLKEGGSEGIVGRLARCEIKTKEIVQVEDWDEFYKWARRNNRLDLFQRRLNEKGIKEIWEAKKKVRGVTRDQVTTLSVGKR